MTTLTALLGILAGATALASCANDTARLKQAGEAGDWQRQANACVEEPASPEEMEMLAKPASEKGFAEKFEQARAQHEDVIMALVEHVTELNLDHALPGAANADKHGLVTVFAPPDRGAAVEDVGSSLWSDVSCERVYLVRVCFETGKNLRYRFCSENSAFDLLSAEQRVGSEWIELR